MNQAAEKGRGSASAKQMRNALCQCGSGEKYKRCCGSLATAGQDPGGVPASAAAEQHYQQGVQALRAGQIPLAMAALVAAIQSDATHFDAHVALGSALMQSGRFAQAAGILSQAVTLRPDAPLAHRDLGAAYDHQNLHEQAIAAFARAVELSPRLSDVQLRLSQLYALYSRTEEASACLEKAAGAQAKTTLGRLYRADACLLRGQTRAAEEWARKAVALEPASHAAHGTLGGVLYAQGRFDEAGPSFETALSLNPASAKSWEGLARCRKFGEDDRAILGRMSSVLQRNDLADEARTTIHFAMGKVFDDLGDYARAMEQFDAGNTLRARGLTFDRAGLAALVDRTIARFTPDFMAGCAALATSDERLLFIVGMYRSGTTLAEQIVSSHPSIEAGGELTVWAPGDLEVEAPEGQFDPHRTRAALAKYLAVVQKIGPAAARITDKLPTNFFRLGAIHALIPRARIIHCQRDPIDTCLSIYTTFFSSRIPYAARQDDLVFCYRQYLRMMAHWRQVLPSDILLDVTYESLIADPEAQTRRLIAFTGLAWNDACLAPEKNARTIRTSSAWQARQPVYATSLQRWRRYEPWLGELRQLIAQKEVGGAVPAPPRLNE